MSAIPLGFEGAIVTVECDMNRGLPAFSIVGLPNTTVNEARDRVRSALVNAGFDFPARKITINLAPAELQKEGTGLDLPIALSVLAVSDQLPEQKPNEAIGGPRRAFVAQSLDEMLFAGELSLNGEIYVFSPRRTFAHIEIVVIGSEPLNRLSLITRRVRRFHVPLNTRLPPCMVSELALI